MEMEMEMEMGIESIADFVIDDDEWKTLSLYCHHRLDSFSP